MGKLLLSDVKAFKEECQYLKPMIAIEHGTSLSVLKKTADFKKIMHVLLQNLEHFYQIPTNNRMPVDVIKETVDSLVTRYYYLKWEELLYVFTQAKTGKFGTMYSYGYRNKITLELLCAWIDRYDMAERQQAVEAKRISEHGKHKGLGPLEIDMQAEYERYKDWGPVKNFNKDNRAGMQQKQEKERAEHRKVSAFLMEQFIKKTNNKNQKNEDDH